MCFSLFFITYSLLILWNIVPRCYSRSMFKATVTAWTPFGLQWSQDTFCSLNTVHKHKAVQLFLLVFTAACRWHLQTPYLNKMVQAVLAWSKYTWTVTNVWALNEEQTKCIVVWHFLYSWQVWYLQTEYSLATPSAFPSLLFVIFEAWCDDKRDQESTWEWMQFSLSTNTIRIDPWCR